MLKSLIVLVLFPLFTQEIESIKMNKEKYIMSGKLMYTSFYQGGAPKPDTRLNELPLANYTIAVVAYSNADVKPEFVKKITTNEKGEFSIELPVGKYGFVSEDEIHNLNPGQWLPGSTQKENNFTVYSTYWSSYFDGPVEITNQNVAYVCLVLNKQTACLDCP